MDDDKIICSIDLCFYVWNRKTGLGRKFQGIFLIEFFAVRTHSVYDLEAEKSAENVLPETKSPEKVVMKFYEYP